MQHDHLGQVDQRNVLRGVRSRRKKLELPRSRSRYRVYWALYLPPLRGLCGRSRQSNSTKPPPRQKLVCRSMPGACSGLYCCSRRYTGRRVLAQH